MKILAIDPSTTSCGWATFRDGQIIGKAVIKATGKDPFVRAEYMANALHFVMCSEQPTYIICEYPHKGGPGMKSKSITILFHLCGMIHGIAKFSHLHIEFVEPMNWKGNIPKDIHQKRNIPKIKEKYGIDISGESGDTIDAILLGDWFVDKITSS